MSELYLRNRQRTRPIQLPLLRSIAEAALAMADAREYELGIFLVSAREMTRVNETYLEHAGSTDVITFSYGRAQRSLVHGEILICLDEALVQARRFRTTWQSELVRYLVHGILHCQGYDDAAPALRRLMKKKENQLVRQIGRQFCLRDLGRKARVAA